MQLLPAQTLKQYLELRKKYGITQGVGFEAFETFIGKRTMEVKGVVKGGFRIGKKQGILVEPSEGTSLVIYAKEVPDWLLGNSVPARLLVVAERQQEGAELKSWLLGVATEQDIARIERAAQAALIKKQPEIKKAIPVAVKPPPKSQVRNWYVPPHQAIPTYAGFIKGQNPQLSDKQAVDIATGIIGYSIRYGVDARLITAMVMVESGFDPGATSRVGAQGLGQLMPGTARGMGITNSYDTFQNLYGTVRVIRGHMERYSNNTRDDFEKLVLSLAAYNAGEGAVKKHGGVPPYKETQAYVRRVIALYYKFIGK